MMVIATMKVISDTKKIGIRSKKQHNRAWNVQLELVPNIILTGHGRKGGGVVTAQGFID
jgi:hypothetical protein